MYENWPQKLNRIIKNLIFSRSLGDERHKQLTASNCLELFKQKFFNEVSEMSAVSN